MKKSQYYQVIVAVWILAVASVVFTTTRMSFAPAEPVVEISVEWQENNEIKVVSDNDNSIEVNSSEDNLNSKNLYTEFFE